MLVEETDQTYDLLVVLNVAVVVSKFVLVINGVPSVMCSGDLLMLKLLVVTWDTMGLYRLLVEDVSIPIFELNGL